MKRTLLLATGNPGKLASLRRLLEDLPLRLAGLDVVPHVRTVAETGATFERNAVLKACGYAQQSGLLTLADDSGLEVKALGGAPGVYSARYGGPGLRDADRCALLLRHLRAIGSREREAQFVCVVAVAWPDGGSRAFRGVCAGRIAYAARGTHGFGYDPIFVPAGSDRTYAEVEARAKDRVSHRAQAMQAARRFLLALVSPDSSPERRLP